MVWTHNIGMTLASWCVQYEICSWSSQTNCSIRDFTVLPNQQTQNICITFIQRRPNVFDVGPTLYTCYTNVLYLLGTSWLRTRRFTTSLSLSGDNGRVMGGGYRAVTLRVCSWAWVNDGVGTSISIVVDIWQHKDMAGTLAGSVLPKRQCLPTVTTVKSGQPPVNVRTVLFQWHYTLFQWRHNVWWRCAVIESA